MCTFAWGVASDQLWVCFNRDEDRGRSPAEPPRIHAYGGNSVAYATDPKGGGTWLAVSSAGYIAVLMNNYSGTNRSGNGLTSRGKLVKSLVRLKNLSTASENLPGLLRQDRYAPFFLFLLNSREQEMWIWDGDSLTSAFPCPRFWTTSSYKTKDVRQWRTRRWNEQVGGRQISLEDAGLILSGREGDPAYCMTMDRPDARTVSQSAVRLDEHGMEYRYYERQPDGYGYCDPVLCRW